MSVTFFVKDAPTQTIPCPYCTEYGKEEFQGRCDEWCDGLKTESLAPEVNFANMNARRILEKIEINCNGYLCGTAEHEELAGIQVKIAAAIEEERRGIDCSFVASQEDHHRLTRLKEVFDYAEQDKGSVCWS